MVLGLFFPAMLLAQPQILPSVEIGSDLIIKAPIVKKQLPFPVEVPADSLASFIPREMRIEHTPLAPQWKTMRPFHLWLHGDSSYQGNLCLSMHPAWYHLPLIRIGGSHQDPGGGYNLSELGIHVQTRFSKNFTLSHDVHYQDARVDSSASEILGYELSHSRESLGLGAAQFRDSRTHLVLEDMISGDEPGNGLAYGLRHSHRFFWGWFRLQNEFLWQDDSPGLSVKFHVPVSSGGIPDLDLGAITDFQQVLPAVDIHKRIDAAPGFYLEISNHASLKSWPLKELAKGYPWSALPEEIPITLKPLDLSLQAFKVFQEESFVQRVSLSHNSGYSLDEPTLRIIPGSDETEVFFQDILANTTTLDLSFKLLGLKLEQSFELNLANLPDGDWQRLPYSSLLCAKTRIRRIWGRFACVAGFDQHYLIEDEEGNELSSIMDLGLDLRYDISSEISLTASLSNLLDHKYQNFGNLPEGGRTFSLGLSYLPLNPRP